MLVVAELEAILIATIAIAMVTDPVIVLRGMERERRGSKLA